MKIFKLLWHAFFPPPKPIPLVLTEPTPGLVGFAFWDSFWAYCRRTDYGTHGTLNHWCAWENAALQQAPRLKVYLEDGRPVPLPVLGLTLRYTASFQRACYAARWETAHIVYNSLRKEVLDARKSHHA